MSATYERTEKNKVKIFFSASPAEFDEALNEAYHKNKSSINLPGFRKGKVSRQLIEMRFGKDFFYPDAINSLIQSAYSNALDELTDEFEVASQADVNLISATKEDGVSFSADVYIEPDVEIGEYKGLTYVPEDTFITDSDLEDELNEVKEKNSRIVTVSDRKSQMDDDLIIDFVGYIDDEPFEGGESVGHNIVLGSGALIDNFEEQLVGYGAGDKVTVTVTFPEEYMREDLSGKQAKFEVTIQEVREKVYPEIDDEFAQDVSEFDTLEEYKNDIRKSLEKEALETAETQKKNQLFEALTASYEADIPQSMIDDEMELRIRDIRRHFGPKITMAQYAARIGTSEEELMTMFRNSSIEVIKLRLALLKIAELEKFEITDDEIVEKLKADSEKFGTGYDDDNDEDEDENEEPERDKDQAIKELLESKRYKKDVKRDMLIDKAIEFIMEHAAAVPPEEIEIGQTEETEAESLEDVTKGE